MEPYHLWRMREREAKLQADIARLTLKLEQVQNEIRTPAGWSIDDLCLSVRAHNCLKIHAEIASVGDLVQWSARDLLKIKNLGRSTLKEIEESVSELGLSLR